MKLLITAILVFNLNTGDTTKIKKPEKEKPREQILTKNDKKVGIGVTLILYVSYLLFIKPKDV